MTTTNTLHAVNTIALIRPLTGEFADSRLELAFRNSTWEQVVLQQRSSLLILAVLVLAFALPDFVAMEAGPALWLLATYRALFALALLVGLQALRRAPELGLHGHLLMWLALLGYPFLFLFCALRPELRMFNIRNCHGDADRRVSLLAHSAPSCTSGGASGSNGGDALHRVVRCRFE